MFFRRNIGRRLIGSLAVIGVSLSGCTIEPIETLSACPDRVIMTHEVAEQMDSVSLEGHEALHDWVGDQLVQDEQVDDCHAVVGEAGG